MKSGRKFSEMIDGMRKLTKTLFSKRLVKQSLLGEKMDYKGMTGKQIEAELINSVVTNEPVQKENADDEFEDEREDEEEDELEEKYKSVGTRSSLKIFFIKSEVTPNKLHENLVRASDRDLKINNLISKYNVSVIEKEDNYFVLVFHWIDRQTDIIYLIKANDSYWEVLTNERMRHVNDTLVRLLRLAVEAGVSRIWTERRKFDEMVRNLIAQDSITGFVAKKMTATYDKKVTIVVYGGEQDDLVKARRDFEAEPTRINFSKHNSPAAAIVGSMASDPGCLQIQRMIPEAVSTFYTIRDRVKNEYQIRFEQLFFGKDGTKEERSENEDGSCSRMAPNPRSVCAIFTEWDEDKISSVINRILLNGYNTGKSRYFGYEWADDNSFLLHDMERGGIIQLRLEKESKCMILYSVEPNREWILNDFAEFMLDKIDNRITFKVCKSEA
jgi:hypothetical protein